MGSNLVTLIMRHPRLIEWEKKLKRTLDIVDDYLEDKYGQLYELHPSRAYRGTTSNKAHDGLFNIGASFTAGYGSKYGRGYVVDIDMINGSLFELIEFGESIDGLTSYIEGYLEELNN